MTKEEDIKAVEGIMSQHAGTRNTALQVIYNRCYPMIETFVMKNGGSVSDTKDVFQQGTMILYQNIKRSKFRGDSSLSTYLYSVCRNLWFKELKQNALKIHGKEKELELNFEEVSEAQINIQAVKKIILELKEGCQDILVSFYYEMKSMKEIAEDLNLGSEQSARNKKSRCLKYLTQKISDRGLTYDNFIQ